ncbi:hypothetical protein KRP22_006044 [Phytophthora ramorum]|nr:hypothetical protein KRP22_2826 [Phytophthora ramorum]
MEKTRNKILANSGRVELDAEPYDHLKTTKAAVRKLKGTRKAARVLYSRTASMDSRVESNSSSEATEGDRDSEWARAQDHVRGRERAAVEDAPGEVDTQADNERRTTAASLLPQNTMAVEKGQGRNELPGHAAQEHDAASYGATTMGDLITEVSSLGEKGRAEGPTGDGALEVCQHGDSRVSNDQ